MPTFEKRGRKWRVQVMRHGERLSKTFDTKAEAAAWASEEGAGAGRQTLDAALERYAREVSPGKRGAKWELNRIGLLRREAKHLMHRQLADLGPDHVSAWRDKRLKMVAPASVRRELALLGSIWETARREWRWTSVNPVRDVRLPANPKPRKRVISDDEADAIVLALGYTGGVPENVSQRVAVAFLFALETAMRAGEIAGIDRRDIRGRVVHLPKTKNDDPRDVPLTPDAVKLLELCPDGFGVTAAQIDALFRKGRAKAAKGMPSVRTIHFHDTRRTATVMLSKKLEPMELAKVTGHRDLKVLLSTYYAIEPETLADKLT